MHTLPMMSHFFHTVITGIKTVKTGSRSLRESVATLILAVIIGGVLAMLFIPSIKQAVWPALDSFFSSLFTPEVVDVVLGLFV